MGLFGSVKTTKESAEDSCAKRERWTPEENVFILQHAHNESGIHDWDEVAVNLAVATANQRQGDPRTADAVRNHYHRLLKSEKGAFGLLPPVFSSEKIKVERIAWTPQEDEIIQRCVAAIGFKWRNIAKQLPLCPTTGKQRSDSSVRNRWSRLSRKENQVKPDTLAAGNSLAPPRRKKTVTAVTVTAAAAAAAADDDWNVVDDVRLASVAPPAVSRRHPPFGELARYDSMREESARSWRQADDEEDIEGALSAGLRTSMSFGELALAPAPAEPIAAPMLALAPAVAEVVFPTADRMTPCADPTATVFGVPEGYGRPLSPTQYVRCLPDVVPLAPAPSASTIVRELKDATTGTTGTLTEFNLDDFVNHVAKLEEAGAPLIVEDHVTLVGS